MRMGFFFCDFFSDFVFVIDLIGFFLDRILDRFMVMVFGGCVRVGVFFIIFGRFDDGNGSSDGGRIGGDS